MIKARGISKYHDRVQALADVDVTLGAGRILGLVGTNGAGRTTLLNILATLVRPTSGHVDIDGIDALRHPFRVRPDLGFVPQAPVFDGGTTVGELLDFAAAMRVPAPGKARPSVHTELVCDGLDPDMPLSALSAGSGQKVALAAALARGPRLLLLDEPLSHLDPMAATRVHGVIRDFHAQGGTVVMACNRVADVEALCDEVAFFHRGRLLRTMEVGGSGLDLGAVFEGLVQEASLLREGGRPGRAGPGR
jgi:ABC-2 type transport system ATP-binding protein